VALLARLPPASRRFHDLFQKVRDLVGAHEKNRFFHFERLEAVSSCLTKGTHFCLLPLLTFDEQAKRSATTSLAFPYLPVLMARSTSLSW
jgi:hypothetical protein